MGQRGPKSTYPWSEWFEQKRLRAVGGRDYRCTQRSFVQQLRNAATKMGYLVHVKRLPNCVSVLIVKKEGADA